MVIEFPVTGANFTMAIPEFICIAIVYFMIYALGTFSLGVFFTLCWMLWFVSTKIDYYVSKKLVKEETGIFFYYLWFRKKLDPEEFLVHYEPVFFIGGRGTDERALVLHFKRSRIFRFSLRNRIRLSVLKPDDPRLAIYIEAIESMSGYKVIKFDKIVF